MNDKKKMHFCVGKILLGIALLLLSVSSALGQVQYENVRFFKGDEYHKRRIELFEDSTFILGFHMFDVCTELIEVGTYSIHGDTVVFANDVDLYKDQKRKIQTSENALDGYQSISIDFIDPIINVGADEQYIDTEVRVELCGVDTLVKTLGFKKQLTVVLPLAFRLEKVNISHTAPYSQDVVNKAIEIASSEDHAITEFVATYFTYGFERDRLEKLPGVRTVLVKEKEGTAKIKEITYGNNSKAKFVKYLSRKNPIGYLVE